MCFQPYHYVIGLEQVSDGGVLCRGTLRLKTESIWEALMTVIFTLSAIPVSLMSLSQVRRFST